MGRVKVESTVLQYMCRKGRSEQPLTLAEGEGHAGMLPAPRCFRVVFAVDGLDVPSERKLE